MDMILRILFILAKGCSPFALPQLVTYWLTGGDDIVNELYLLSRHNNPLDPAMTGLQGVGQLLPQLFAVRDLSPSGPGLVIYWMAHVPGTIPFTPTA